MRNFIYLVFLCLSTGLAAQDAQSSEGELRLYPNPVQGEKVFLASPDNELKQVVVYDVFGKVVLREQVTAELGVGKLPPGVYLLQVRASGQTHTRKLIIK